MLNIKSQNNQKQLLKRKKRKNAVEPTKGRDSLQSTALTGQKLEDQWKLNILFAQKELYHKHLSAGNVVRDPTIKVPKMERQFPIPAMKKKRVPCPMVHPRHTFKVLWDVIIALLVLWIVVVTPLDYALTLDWDVYIVTVVATVFFSLDIFLTFWTARDDRQRRRLVMNPMRIARWYICGGRLFLDIIGTVPWELFYPPLTWLRLVRCYTLMEVSQQVVRTFNRPGRWPIVLSFIMPGMWLFIYTHWMSCGWILLHTDAEREAGNNNDWTIYLRSLYWTVTTITTVGYGDQTPVNNEQIGYTLLVELFGVGMFAYLFGRMVDAILSAQRAQQELREKMNLLNAFMNYKKYPQWLKKQVWDYYIFQYDNFQSEEMFGPVLNALSPTLRQQVSFFEKKSVINVCPDLRMLQTATQRLMAEAMDALVFLPKQMIYAFGDSASQVYFVERGTVVLEDAVTGETLREVRAGDMFGYIEARAGLIDGGSLTEVTRAFNARAKSYVSAYSLDFQVVQSCLEREPQFFMSLNGHMSNFGFSLLQKIDTLQGLGDEFLGEMSRNAAVVYVPENTYLFLHNDPADYVYIIYSGILHRVTGDVVVEMLRGMFVGEIEATMGTQRSASVFTAMPSVIFKIRRAKFLKWFGANKAFRDLVTKNAKKKRDLGRQGSINFGKHIDDFLNNLDPKDSSRTKETAELSHFGDEVLSVEGSVDMGGGESAGMSVSGLSMETAGCVLARGLPTFSGSRTGMSSEMHYLIRDISHTQTEIHSLDRMRFEAEKRVQSLSDERRLLEDRLNRQLIQCQKQMRNISTNPPIQNVRAVSDEPLRTSPNGSTKSLKSVGSGELARDVKMRRQRGHSRSKSEYTLSKSMSVSTLARPLHFKNTPQSTSVGSSQAKSLERMDSYLSSERTNKSSVPNTQDILSEGEGNDIDDDVVSVDPLNPHNLGLQRSAKRVLSDDEPTGPLNRDRRKTIEVVRLNPLLRRSSVESLMNRTNSLGSIPMSGERAKSVAGEDVRVVMNRTASEAALMLELKKQKSRSESEAQTGAPQDDHVETAGSVYEVFDHTAQLPTMSLHLSPNVSYQDSPRSTPSGSVIMHKKQDSDSREGSCVGHFPSKNSGEAQSPAKLDRNPISRIDSASPRSLSPGSIPEEHTVDVGDKFFPVADTSAFPPPPDAIALPAPLSRSREGQASLGESPIAGQVSSSSHVVVMSPRLSEDIDDNMVPQNDDKDEDGLYVGKIQRHQHTRTLSVNLSGLSTLQETRESDREESSAGSNNDSSSDGDYDSADDE